MISRRECEKGKIALKVSLAADEVACLEAPVDGYLISSRYSYFSVVAKVVVEHFRSCVVDFSTDAWFESNGVPLKGHLPIGVLYDVAGKEEPFKPWNIVVHFHDFPGSLLLSCNIAEESEKLYFQSLKQASYLLNGHARAYNSLSVEELSILWNAAISECDGANIWEIESSKLVPPVEEIKYIPIRLLRQGVVSQKPVVLKPAGNAVRTLIEVLTDDFKLQLTAEIEVVVQGITPPLNSEIYQLWRSLQHRDLFLYIIVRE